MKEAQFFALLAFLEKKGYLNKRVKYSDGDCISFTASFLTLFTSDTQKTPKDYNLFIKPKSMSSSALKFLVNNFNTRIFDSELVIK